MWICAACGTEAQRPEICSGCGSNMKPFEQADKPKEERYRFCLVMYPSGKTKATEFVGPFPSVMSADQWWDTHRSGKEGYGYADYEVVLMEAPDNDAPDC